MTPANRPRLPKPALWSAVAVVSIGRLVLAVSMATPIVQPDEGAYLGIAHQFAFGRGLAPSNAPYHPGWGLVLAPISRVLDDPLRVYRAALVVNVLLGLAAFWYLLALTRRLAPQRSGHQQIAIAAVVAIAPALVLSSAMANVTSVFVAGTLGITVLVVRAWELDRAGRWALAGLASGALVAVHPTALPVAAGVGLAALLGLPRARVRGLTRRLAALVAGAAPSTLASLLLIRYAEHLTPAGTAGSVASRLGQTAGQVGAAVTGRHVAGLLAELAGQLLYLTAASAGIVVIGLCVGLRAVVPAFGVDAPTIVRLRAFAAVITVGAITASVLVINPPDDSPLERLMYGRYVEHVVALVLLVGLVGLLDHVAAGRWRRDLVVITCSTVVLGGVFLVTRFGKPGNLLTERQDVLGLTAPLELLQRLGHATLGWTVGLALVAGIGGAGTIVLAGRRAGPTALLTVLATAATTLTVTGGILLVKGSHGRAHERTLSARIASAARRSPTSCVGYRQDLDGEWHLATYAFLLPDVRFRPVADSAVPPGCDVALLAAPDDPVAASLGLVAVGAERTIGVPPVVLYELPGSGS